MPHDDRYGMTDELEKRAIDHDNTDLPVCPNCGYADEQWHEDAGTANDGDDWETDCPNCDSTYSVTFCVSYSFTTAEEAPQ